MYICLSLIICTFVHLHLLLLFTCCLHCFTTVASTLCSYLYLIPFDFGYTLLWFLPRCYLNFLACFTLPVHCVSFGSSCSQIRRVCIFQLCITFVYLLRPLFLTCSVAVSVCISGYMPFIVASSQIYIAYPLEFLLHYNLF
jgi:hypothetical protein